MKYNGVDIVKIVQNGQEILKVMQNGENLYQNSLPVENPELVINGDFSKGSANWTQTGVWAYSMGQAVFLGTTPWSGLLRQWIAVSPNTKYEITITHNGFFGVTGYIGVWGKNLGDLIISASQGIFMFTTQATATYIRLDLNNGTNITGATFDNVSIKKVL